jgi:hypothetical protein
VKEPAFKTEAALCATFIAWATAGDRARCFAEWDGWDILVVLPGGLQLGIEAKLRLNAEVIAQAAPTRWDFELDGVGPDFRGVLVPEASRVMAGLAQRAGLVVFQPSGWRPGGFCPDLLDYLIPPGHYGDSWVDWNPRQRLELPPVATDAIAGSPCPVTLTHWKLGALAVLAEIEVKGAITTKRMRELGVNPSRWLSCFWLQPAEKRGDWVRGARCPKFDEQHPTAYALAREKAKAAVPA